VAKTKERAAEDQQKEQEYQRYLEATADLEKKLQESREEWQVKLKALYIANEEEEKPILEQTADIQDKLSKLELKKNELERQIFPERFAVAELPDEVGGRTFSLPGAEEKSEKEGLSVTGDDVEGEQEFGGATPTPQPSSPYVSKSLGAGYLPTPVAEVDSAPTASGAAENEQVRSPALAPAELELDPDEIFGQIEDPDDDAPLMPAAKKPRVEGEGEGE